MQCFFIQVWYLLSLASFGISFINFNSQGDKYVSCLLKMYLQMREGDVA